MKTKQNQTALRAISETDQTKGQYCQNLRIVSSIGGKGLNLVIAVTLAWNVFRTRFAAMIVVSSNMEAL